MGFYSFKLPDLGEGIVESEIDKWHVQPGDRVEEDQPIAEVITDKAVIEVSSPITGAVVALACEAGEVIAVGSELIRFEVAGDGNIKGQAEPETTSAAPPTSPPGQSKPIEAEAAKPAAKSIIVAASVAEDIALPHRTILTSPSLRRRAREANIDLSLVPGSGPDGRITRQDMDAYLSVAGNPTSRKRQGSNEVKIKGLRRVIAQKMQQSKRQIPHYSYIEEVDVTQLEELRQQLNAKRKDSQPKLTLMPFIMQALIKVLPDYPHCNAHFDDSNDLLIQHQPVHIGIATMTATGLMVPVVKHCESLDIWQSASEMARLSQAARDSRANKDELCGSTITITSLGAIGGIATTPIINAPETAIIGVNKLQQRPVVKNDIIVIRKIMNLSSSFDHRIVDGYDGAQLIQSLKALLENPAAIFI